jgi:hypothetical protein
VLNGVNIGRDGWQGWGLGNGDLQFVKHALVSRQVQRSGQHSSSTAAAVPRYWRMERWRTRSPAASQRYNAFSAHRRFRIGSHLCRPSQVPQVAGCQQINVMRDPDGARIDSIAIGIGLNGCDRGGFAVFAGNAMPTKPCQPIQDSDTTAAHHQRLRRACRCGCVPVCACLLDKRPPSADAAPRSLNLSCARHVLHCFSHTQTLPSPLDRSSTVSAAPSSPPLASPLHLMARMSLPSRRIR